MQLPVRVVVKHTPTGKPVQGEILRVTPAHVSLLARWVHRKNDEDRTWHWDKIIEDSQDPDGPLECYGLFVGSNLEGLISIDTKSRAGDGYLTIDYLATNPSNRDPNGIYKGIGLCLLGYALQRSYEVNLEGQIWLESLAGARSFYSSLGFLQTDELSTEGYDVYVLNRDIAAKLKDSIKERGYLL